jgi:glycosyltransferase involved in cell wall biosynthesis
MPTPQFSIIIPTCNRPEYLREALVSVLAQTIADFECIVIDDASAVPAQIPDDARIRLIRLPSNGGPAVARNAGLEEARGCFIVFLDDDDLYTRDRLALTLTGLTRAPVAVCWCRFLEAPMGQVRLLEGDISDVILNAGTPHLGTAAIDRTIAPRFDERFWAAEDVEWWLRITQRVRVTTVPQIGYLIRRHSGDRYLIDYPARIRCRQMLLDAYDGYFRAHPTAAAFQWKRIGLMASRVGDHRLASEAYKTAFRLAPGLSGLWHLVQTAARGRST